MFENDASTCVFPLVFISLAKRGILSFFLCYILLKIQTFYIWIRCAVSKNSPLPSTLQMWNERCKIRNYVSEEIFALKLLSFDVSSKILQHRILFIMRHIFGEKRRKDEESFTSESNVKHITSPHCNTLQHLCCALFCIPFPQ